VADPAAPSIQLFWASGREKPKSPSSRERDDRPARRPVQDTDDAAHKGCALEKERRICSSPTELRAN